MMRIVVMGMIAASLGLTGCQQTKVTGTPQTSARQNAAPPNGGGGGGTYYPPPTTPNPQSPPPAGPGGPVVRGGYPPPPGGSPPPAGGGDPNPNIPVPPPPGTPTYQQPPGGNYPVPPQGYQPSQPPQTTTTYIPPNPVVPPSTNYESPPSYEPPVTQQTSPPDTYTPPVVDYHNVPTTSTTPTPTLPTPPRNEDYTQQPVLPPPTLNVPPATNTQTVQTQPIIPTQQTVTTNPPVSGGPGVGPVGGTGVQPQQPGVGTKPTGVVPQSGGTTIPGGGGGNPPVGGGGVDPLVKWTKQNPLNQELPPVPRPPPQPKPVIPDFAQVVDKACQPQKIDAQFETKELDVLFLVDTSDSMRGGKKNAGEGELALIAAEMPEFAKRINEKVDLRVAVMLGHGPGSPRYHGRLFKVDENDPAVLKNKTTLGSDLLNKIQKIDHRFNDPTEAQGEALQLSLYNAITKPDLLKAAQGKDGNEFFRKNAALVVISISDEQDVCYDYLECKPEGDGRNCRPAQVANPLIGKNSCRAGEILGKDKNGKDACLGQDRYEVNFFNNVCKRAANNPANGKQFSYLDLWKALLELKGGDKSKLIVAPVVYKNNVNIPEVGVEDENEMGHGHLDLAGPLCAQSPVIADLAAVNPQSRSSTFATQMDFFGQFANFQMMYSHKFQCVTDVNENAINRTSIQAEVFDNQSGNLLARFSGQCLPGRECPSGIDGYAEGRPTGKAMEVTLDYAKLKEKLERYNLQEGEVRMTFKTLSNRDPSTGASFVKPNGTGGIAP